MSAEDRGGREEVEDEVEDEEETAEGVRVVAAAGLARMKERAVLQVTTKFSSVVVVVLVLWVPWWCPWWLNVRSGLC
jgi:hypothetical protein